MTWECDTELFLLLTKVGGVLAIYICLAVHKLGVLRLVVTHSCVLPVIQAVRIAIIYICTPQPVHMQQII